MKNSVLTGLSIAAIVIVGFLFWRFRGSTSVNADDLAAKPAQGLPAMIINPYRSAAAQPVVDGPTIYQETR